MPLSIRFYSLPLVVCKRAQKINLEDKMKSMIDYNLDYRNQPTGDYKI